MLIFQSTRPSRASTSNTKITQKSQSISIHKALAGLDVMLGLSYPHIVISIHKALAGLDYCLLKKSALRSYFNPQGPRGPRPSIFFFRSNFGDFNPQGPRGPRRAPGCFVYRTDYDFNPQGPRGPRPMNQNKTIAATEFQSTRPSRASTLFCPYQSTEAFAFQSTRPSRASTVTQE